MRRQTLLAGLTLVLEFGACVDTGRADLFCEQPVWNAGQVHNGVPLERHFTFTNRGAAAVEITDMRSTCGCLSPRLEKRTLGPGETATLLLEINTLALAEGTQSWRTRLLYRDGETTKELEPRHRRRCGDRGPGPTVRPDAACRLAGHPSADGHGPPAPAVANPRRRLGDAVPAYQHHRSRARWDRDGAARSPGNPAVVPRRTTRGRRSPLLGRPDIPRAEGARHRGQTAAAVRDRFAAPGDLRLRPGPGASPRVVRLSAADGSAVEIERVEAADPAVHCTWTRDTVTVEIDPARLTGDLQTTVRVHLRKPVAETVAISVICVVR